MLSTSAAQNCGVMIQGECILGTSHPNLCCPKNCDWIGHLRQGFISRVCVGILSSYGHPQLPPENLKSVSCRCIARRKTTPSRWAAAHFYKFIARGGGGCGEMATSIWKHSMAAAQLCHPGFIPSFDRAAVGAFVAYIMVGQASFYTVAVTEYCVISALPRCVTRLW